jgi:hypothetical protein
LASTPASNVFSSLHLSSSYDLIKILLEPTPVTTDFVQIEVAAPGFAWPSGVIPLINSSDEDVAGDSTAYGLFNFQSGNLYVSYLTSGELTPINTPEPATLTMLASGLVAFGGFGVSRRRRRASKQNEVC